MIRYESSLYIRALIVPVPLFIPGKVIDSILLKSISKIATSANPDLQTKQKPSVHKGTKGNPSAVPPAIRLRQGALFVDNGTTRHALLLLQAAAPGRRPAVENTGSFQHPALSGVFSGDFGRPDHRGFHIHRIIAQKPERCNLKIDGCGKIAYNRQIQEKTGKENL